MVRVGAVDDRATLRTELLVDGVTAAVASYFRIDYPWDVGGRAGMHRLEARAWDVNGNLGSTWRDVVVP